LRLDDRQTQFACKIAHDLVCGFELQKMLAEIVVHQFAGKRGEDLHMGFGIFGIAQRQQHHHAYRFAVD